MIVIYAAFERKKALSDRGITVHLVAEGVTLLPKTHMGKGQTSCLAATAVHDEQFTKKIAKKVKKSKPSK